MIRKLPDEYTHWLPLEKEFLDDTQNFVGENHPFFRLEGAEHKNDFTRNRKLPLIRTLALLVDRTGNSTYSDLMTTYCKVKNWDPATDDAFQKRRQLLNPEGIKAMLIHATSNLYKRHPEAMGSYKTFIPVIFDGSDIWIPRNEETEKVFGCSKKNPGPDDPCMAKLSTAYAAIDNLYLDVEIECYKFSERELAMRHIEKLQAEYPDLKFCFIMDRGYFSIELMEFIHSKGFFFIFRLPVKTLKKHTDQIHPGAQDNISIRFSKAETNSIRDKLELRNKILSTTYNLSVSKPLKDKELTKLYNDTLGDDDKEEYLVLLSNIPAASGTNPSWDPEIPSVSVCELEMLYRQYRWTIETSYDRLKDEFGLESYLSQIPLLLKQEIYASIYSYNLVSLSIRTAFERFPIDQLQYKWIQRPNFNKGFTFVKLSVLQAVTEPDPERQAQLFTDMHKEIARHILRKKSGGIKKRRKKIKVRGRNRKW